ncbi:MAG: type II secretion system F family protein [Gammaproteobacteria bacterium]|nr:type II secretion system F family protein [Gammaproteobacteria bacterium]
MDFSLASIASIFFGISIFFLIAFSLSIKPERASDDRGYMDPLPSGLKIIWGPVKIIEYYIASNLPFSYLDGIDTKLQKSGVSYVLTAEEFFSLSVVSAIISFFISLYLMIILNEIIPLALLLTPIFFYFLPQIWLQDTKKKRRIRVIRDLPTFLDFITMAVEAGLNLTGALQQSVDKGPKGALRNEFAIVLRDLRYGITRTEALKRMSARLDISDVANFVNAIIQAEKIGSSMATTLRVQAEQRRNERFQRAEKQAMEAPVKLVFPLIVFIFPVTFIILAFPIVMKFLG